MNGAPLPCGLQAANMHPDIGKFEGKFGNKLTPVPFFFYIAVICKSQEDQASLVPANPENRGRTINANIKWASPTLSPSGLKECNAATRSNKHTLHERAIEDDMQCDTSSKSNYNYMRTA